MNHRGSFAMNLKLSHYDMKALGLLPKKPVSSIKEERRRTGRYIAILVGISLFLLAIYHAWVRRIPIVASLVVPALIMFVYVGWVLYTASRDKHKLMDAETGFDGLTLEGTENVGHTCDSPQNIITKSNTPSKESSKVNTPEIDRKNWPQITGAPTNNNEKKEVKKLVTPIILVNDIPPDDIDQKWSHLFESVINDERFKGVPHRRRKRRFCRSRRNAVFKRSYSIA